MRIYRDPDEYFIEGKAGFYVSDWPGVVAAIDGTIIDPQDYVLLDDSGSYETLDGMSGTGEVQLIQWCRDTCGKCIQQMRRADWKAPGTCYDRFKSAPVILDTAAMERRAQHRAKHQKRLDFEAKQSAIA